MSAANWIKFLKRLLLCIIILVVHYAVLFIPVAELFLIYILFFNPKRFRNYLDNYTLTFNK